MTHYHLAAFLIILGAVLIGAGFLTKGSDGRKSWVAECTKTRTFEACNQDYNALQSMDR